MVRLEINIIPDVTSFLEKQQTKTIKQIQEYSKILKAMSNVYNVKIIVALYKSRLTTVYNLKKITNAPDKATIQDKIITLTTYDLIDIKHKNSDDYWIYRKYWKQQHPNSHSDPQFYIPTENIDLIYETIHHQFDNLLNPHIISQLETFGCFFKNFYEKQIQKLENYDLPEIAKRKIIGSCIICGEKLFSTAKYEEFQGELYCQNCLYELYKDKKYLKKTP